MFLLICWFLGHPIGVIYDYTMVGIWQEDEIARGDHLNWDPIAEAGDVKPSSYELSII